MCPSICWIAADLSKFANRSARLNHRDRGRNVAPVHKLSTVGIVNIDI